MSTKFRVKSIFLIKLIGAGLHQAFAKSDTLDLADIVDGKVDVFNLSELVEALHLRDQVALQVQDLQMPAIYVQILNLFYVLLMQ